MKATTKTLLIVQPLFLLLLVFSFAINAQYRLTGTVVRIVDGDTWVIRSSFQDQHCRFLHVDCPEKLQRFGVSASDSVAKFLVGKRVALWVVGKDLYQRNLVGILEIDGVPVSGVDYMFIEKGWAWHDTKYCTCDKGNRLQAIAQQKKVGLWSVPVGCNPPVAPWVWRGMDTKVRRNYERCISTN